MNKNKTLENKSETIVTINDYSKFNSSNTTVPKSPKNESKAKIKESASNLVLVKKTRKRLVSSKIKTTDNKVDQKKILKEKKKEQETRLSLQTIRRFEQLVEVLQKETQYIIKGEFSALGNIAKQKSELIHEYLQLRKELREKCGDEPNWLQLLSSEQLDSLRTTSRSFEFEMNRNQTALKRASNSVQEVMDVYYQAVRDASSFEGTYTSSGRINPSDLPSLSFEKDF